jgi:hypothetical protein
VSDALLRVDPVQHQMVLDRGSQLVSHGLPSEAAVTARKPTVYCALTGAPRFSP